MKKKNIQNISDLKIAHYNILSGGVDRMDKISEVIKEINPDICGLLECVGWETNINEYKNKFKSEGYNFFYFVKANSKYNITIISKIELEITTIKEGIRHVIVGAKIIDKKYPSLNIFYIHLSPVSEEDRLSELSILLKNISVLDNVIIMGDFNSLSPWDEYAKNKLFESFKKNNIIKYGVNHLNFDVIKEIENSGFTDCFKYLKNSFDFSVPTKSNTDVNHQEKIRIDYAFVKNNISKNVKVCKIYKSKTTEIASDHYPLYIGYKNKQ
jgi:endonuclease/exonuclease/phosphatase family metal-dependent hydrolase